MIFYQKDSLQQEIARHKENQKTIGFVPTMGALHQGHLTLVKKALAENDMVVVSIFVNPTQFDNTSDLKKYPRDLQQDEALLNSLEKNLIIFAPSPEQIYGLEVISKKYRFGLMERTMEGKYRSGHFDGVGTVLNLLFRIIMPNKAYFGEKDFQQLQIVRKLVELERLPIKIIGCPIARETSGLAMSSRNKRLSAKQLEQASIIYRILKEVRNKFDKVSIQKLREMVQKTLAEQSNLKLEYFEIAPIATLQPALRKNKKKKYRAFIAVFSGEVRLIDNMALN